ncbi:outer membrane lipoprotein carrier protein LolA [Streptomyces sp. NPDC053499]|uniref:outer membrane lipoprotein carrier protein LolA n=1 Tax=Streptomyces sp. NPDC053499 TaxID=3365707 RepID=UPI0037D75682
MAQIQPRNPRRKAVRYGVPVAVAGVAAATVGLVPALASSGDPDLPKISAEELVAKVAKSDVDHMSGTVKVSTDLGLPSLPGGGGSGGGGGGFGGGPHGSGEGAGKDGKGSGSVAAPSKKLSELASGEHTLRFAADGPDKQRVSVMEDAAEYSLIHNGRELWAYDSGSNAAWHAKAPEGAKGAHGGSAKRWHGEEPDAVTPQKAAKQALKALDKSTSVTVDGTAKIAGRDAYQLVIKPKGAPDSTIESVRIGVDADNGVPLRFTLTPKDGDKPAVDVAYTKVDFGKPDASSFDFTPPKGTEVTEAKPHESAGGDLRGPGPRGLDGLTGSGLEIVNESANDWGKVAKLDTGMPGGLGGPQSGGKGDADAGKLLDNFTDEVKGDFGTGRVFSTRLVNALMTDDGKVYVGAVTKDGLVKAANKDHSAK